MEIKTQWELYYKIKDLIRVHVGTNFGLEKEENGKTLFMVITNGDVSHLGKVRDFLKSLGIEEHSRKKMNKNHAGIAGTILVSMSLIGEESISKIDDLYNKIPKREKGAMKKLRDETSVEQSVPSDSNPPKEIATSDERASRCSKYEFTKYLKSVLRFEGLDPKAFSVKKDGDNLKLCSNNAYVIKTAEEAINFYFGEKVANLYIGNDEHCISFSGTKDESSQSKKFSFSSSPDDKSDINDIKRRLNRIFPSKKYAVQKTKDGFDVDFPVKGLIDLRFALADMGWNIKEKDGGFSIAIARSAKTTTVPVSTTKPAKPVVQTEKIESLPVQSIEGMTKEEAYMKLCELVESEDFNLLDESLKKKILDKKETYLKYKKREEVTIYAESLLTILD